ncbi:MAG: DNA alkylation repair protein [Bacteroidales bacterium]
MQNKDKVIEKLKNSSGPAYKEKMPAFGVPLNYALGMQTPYLRTLAKELRQDHTLTMELWASGIYEAHIPATMIVDYQQITVNKIKKL